MRVVNETYIYIFHGYGHLLDEIFVPSNRKTLWEFQQCSLLLLDILLVIIPWFCTSFSRLNP